MQRDSIDTDIKPIDFYQSEAYSLLPLSLLPDIIADTKKTIPKSILDLSSENGVISKHIAKNMPDSKVISTCNDPSFYHHYDSWYSPNLEFIVMDPTKNIYSNQFELVLSYNLFDWNRDQQAVLQGIKGALVPEGKAILYIPLINKLDLCMALIGLHPRWRIDFSMTVKPRIFFSKSEYLSIISGIGFDILFYVTKQVPYVLNPNQITSMLNKKFPSLNTLSNGEKNAFYDYVVKSLAIHSNSKTTIEYFVPTLKVFAVKTDG